MDLKALRIQILGGSVARRVVLRSLMLVSALSVFSLLQILCGSDPGLIDLMHSNECDAPHMYGGMNLFANRLLMPIWSSLACKEDVNLTSGAVRELTGMKMLDYGAKVLYVGEGSCGVCAFQELGFANVCGVHRHPFFSFKHQKLVYELQYADNSFDFVFSRDLDKVTVPAILVLEIERIVKPGGIGAMLVGVDGLNTNSLIRSATPVSSLLKDSSVVHVGYVQGFTLVVFRKRIYTNGYFQQFHLPVDCKAVVNNRPLMDYVEPLMECKRNGYEKRIAYLPNFIDVPSRKRLVYIDVGPGKNLNSTSFLQSYPVNKKSLNTYIVDHNTSVLLSDVKKPGTTFIYHPGLAEETTTKNPQFKGVDPSTIDEGFDFLAWFKETVQFSDFVVLKMNTGKVELKFLIDLFKSGTICSVDELFLNCSDGLDGKGLVQGDCMDLFRSLRSSGIFVHQWWGD